MKEAKQQRTESWLPFDKKKKMRKTTKNNDMSKMGQNKSVLD